MTETTAVIETIETMTVMAVTRTGTITARTEKVIEMTETTAVIETIEIMTVMVVTRTGIITARTADAQEEMVRDSLVREEMTEVLQHLRMISFLRQSQIQEDQTQERMIQERMTERKIMRQRKILNLLTAS